MGLGTSPLGTSPLGTGTTTGPVVPGIPGFPEPDPTPILTSVGCQSNADTGVITVSGVTPNGNAVITRSVAEMDDFVLRQGARPVDLGGFIITDTEAPVGVPVDYTVRVGEIPTAQRVVQENLMLTPTFKHGVFGWLPGNNRTLSTTTDSTSHSGTVGQLAPNASGVAAAAAPTMVGHVDAAYGAATPFTLTPPTTGGTAIATGDWMMIVHTQSAAVDAPPPPTGWRVLTHAVYATRQQLIWVKKRVGGETGYTVAGAGASPASVTTLLWVRGAMDEVKIAGPDMMPTPGLSGVTITGRKAVLRPSLVVSAFAGIASTATSSAPGLASVTGSTWRFNVSNSTAPAVTTVATQSMANAGLSPTVTTTFADVQLSALGTQVIFQAAGTPANQVIARGKAAAIPAGTEPHLFTGRVRFTTTDLWTWQDVKDQGTWQNLKNTKATWNDVRGSGAVSPGGNYINLFVSIVDPTTGRNYVEPQLALAVNESSVNQWLDFSILLDVPHYPPPVPCANEDGNGDNGAYPCYWDNTIQGNGVGNDYWLDGPADDNEARWALLPGETAPCTAEDGSDPTQQFPCYWDGDVQGNGEGDSYWLDGPGMEPRLVPGIPATAEIRLSHGTSTKEYPVTWYLDEFGLTPGWQRATHGTRYWFSGDSAVPSNPEDYLLPDGIWNSAASDSAMVWSSTVGNSVSVFYGPSAITTNVVCGLDPPSMSPCEPVLISDPTETARYVWAGLISIGDTTHPANLSAYGVLDRADKVASGSVRNWQESELVVQTQTLQERMRALKTFEKGKILLLRNPDPRYPERNWYLACGDITEARVSTDHRDPQRFWTIPFIRVERPRGDIEATDRPTWADVKALGTWANVKALRGNWLGVATGRGPVS